MQGTIGLRERKRVATRQNIERAAVQLAADKSLDAATVEAISELADISPRTFFNYFESKEDAIIGYSEVQSPEELLSFVARTDQEDIIMAVTAMLVRLLHPTLAEPAYHRQRKKLLRRYPQLLNRHVARHMKVHEQVTAATTQILAQKTAQLQKDQHVSLTAEVIVALCGGAVRAVMKEQLQHNIDASEAALTEQAAELARKATQTIT